MWYSPLVPAGCWHAWVGAPAGLKSRPAPMCHVQLGWVRTWNPWSGGTETRPLTLFRPRSFWLQNQWQVLVPQDWRQRLPECWRRLCQSAGNRHWSSTMTGPTGSQVSEEPGLTTRPLPAPTPAPAPAGDHGKGAAAGTSREPSSLAPVQLCIAAKVAWRWDFTSRCMASSSAGGLGRHRKAQPPFPPLLRLGFPLSFQLSGSSL